MRQAALFVGTSGLGWLLDLAVFATLIGAAGVKPLQANLASATCGALFVFAMSSRAVFSRNEGAMTPKVLVLLGFNTLVILLASVTLAWIVRLITALAVLADIALPAPVPPVLAKLAVTPVTLALNFLFVRYLLERFIGIVPGSLRMARRGTRH